MESDLNAVIVPVEELQAANLIQNEVRVSVLHVVGHNGWQRVAL